MIGDDMSEQRKKYTPSNLTPGIALIISVFFIPKLRLLNTYQG